MNLRVTKNGAAISQNVSINLDVAGDQLCQNTQEIGTTAELLTFGNIASTPQAIMIRNLDATNFVEIGGDSGLTIFKIKIPAEQSVYFTPTSATIYAKADTAAVDIILLAFEE